MSENPLLVVYAGYLQNLPLCHAFPATAEVHKHLFAMCCILQTLATGMKLRGFQLAGSPVTEPTVT